MYFDTYIILSGNCSDIHILNGDRLLVIKLQVHQPRPQARQTNLCWEVHSSRLFLNQAVCETGAQSCLSHYNKWFNMGTKAGMWTYINNGNTALFCCCDLLVLWKVSLALTSFGLCFSPEFKSIQGVMWPVETIPPQGTEELHPYQLAAPLPWKKTAMPHRLKEAKMALLQGNLKILWLRS